MLIKAAGFTALFSGCLCIGFFKAGELSKRVQIIRGLEEAALVFEGEILYRLATIYDAAAAAAKYDISGIFKSSLEKIEQLGAAAAFREAAIGAGLEKEETDIMCAFAAGLISPDKEGQLQNVRLCRERLKSALKTAIERKEQLYKLYCASGGLFGAAVSIFFL